MIDDHHAMKTRVGHQHIGPAAQHNPGNIVAARNRHRIGEIDPTYFMTPEELEAYLAEQEALEEENNNNNGN